MKVIFVLVDVNNNSIQNRTEHICDNWLKINSVNHHSVNKTSLGTESTVNFHKMNCLKTPGKKICSVESYKRNSA